MLEVTNLSKRYGQKQAIDGISFSIRQGEAVGFLGVNGAGKSTTMNILTGYLSASDGEVVIDGVDILTEPLKAKAKNRLSAGAAAAVSGYEGHRVPAVFV